MAASKIDHENQNDLASAGSYGLARVPEERVSDATSTSVTDIYPGNVHRRNEELSEYEPASLDDDGYNILAETTEPSLNEHRSDYDVIGQTSDGESHSSNGDDDYYHVIRSRDVNVDAPVRLQPALPVRPVQPGPEHPGLEQPGPEQPGPNPEQNWTSRRTRLVKIGLVCAIVVGGLVSGVGFYVRQYLLNKDDLPQPAQCKEISIVDGWMKVSDTTSAAVICNTGHHFSNGNVLRMVTCQPNGTWTDLPTCQKVTCSLSELPRLENGEIMRSNDTERDLVYGDAVNVSCDSGYHLLGNDSVRCVEYETWTLSPECILCATLNVTHGSWEPVENCSIPATLELGSSTPFMIGSSGELSCHGDMPLNWASVVMGTYNVGSSSQFAESLLYATKQEVLFGEVPGFNVSQEWDKAVFDFRLEISNVSCALERQFYCGVSVEDNTRVFRYINQQIHVASNATDKPTIRMSDQTLVGRSVLVQCESLIGKNETNHPTQQMVVGTKKQSESTCTVHDVTLVSSVAEGCYFRKVWTLELLVDASHDGLNVRCIKLDDGSTEIGSETKTLNVSTIQVILSSSSFLYPFVVGQAASLTCAVGNDPDWTAITVGRYDSNNIFIPMCHASSNRTDASGTGCNSDFINTIRVDRSPTSTNAQVVIDISEVPCDGLQSVLYACVVTLATFEWKEHLVIPTIKKPETPQLTLSREIIEDKDTRKLFYCTGNVGNPPGHIEIHFDIKDFSSTPFLDSQIPDDKNKYGYIYDNELSVAAEGHCGYIQNVTFALTNVTMEMHRHDMYCVIVPNADIIGPVMTSFIQEVKVIPDDYCDITPRKLIMFHPYVCHDYVICSDVQASPAVLGVGLKCAPDMCFTEGTFRCIDCSHYEGCRRADIYTEGGRRTFEEADSTAITCSIEGYDGSLTDILITKDSTSNVIASYNNVTATNTADRIEIPANGSYVIPTEGVLRVLIPRLQCTDAGEYICSSVGGTPISSRLRLTVRGKDNPC